jgi:hypothetical protein
MANAQLSRLLPDTFVLDERSPRALFLLRLTERLVRLLSFVADTLLDPDGGRPVIARPA